MPSPFFRLQFLTPKDTNPKDISRVDKVRQFTLTDSDEDLDTLDLLVDNQDLAQSENPAWEDGNVLLAAFGLGALEAPQRRFKIKKITGFPGIKVTAFEDKTLEANAVDLCRVFTNQTHSAIATAVAAELGFKAPFVQIQTTTTVHPQISQVHEPNARFLKRIASKNGFQFFIDNSIFHWHERDFKQPPLKELVYYTSNQGDILTFKVEEDTASKPGDIKTIGLDPMQKEIFEVAANNKETKRVSLGSVVGVFDEETGELQLKNRVVRPTPKRTQAQAKDEADASFKRTLENQVKLKLTLPLSPDIPAKTILLIQGIGPVYSGNWYVKQVKHTVAGDSGRTVATCLRNAVSKDLRDSTEGQVDGEKNESTSVQNKKVLRKVGKINPETGKLEVELLPAPGAR